jgi:glycosyltransferase domain-containing protein
MKAPVSLIIPTFCRAEYLERQFQFFVMHGLDYPIYIVDGSPGHYCDTNKTLVEKFENSLNLIYSSKPSTDPVSRVFERLIEIDTPYVITNNDDDFIIPAQIKKGITFLDSHPDYSLYHGRAITIDTHNCDPMGNIIRFYKYNQNSLEMESSLERVMLHQAHYNSTHHSLQRTDNAVKSYETAISHKIDWLYLELFRSVISVARGKVKMDNGLYLVRQGDQKRYYDVNSLEDRINWLTEPNWCSQYAFYIEALSEEIAQIDKKDLNFVKKKVGISFWLYLIPLLSQGYPVYMKNEGINALANIHNSESPLLRSFKINIKYCMETMNSVFINHTQKSTFKRYTVDYSMLEHMEKQFLGLDKYFKVD